MKTAKQWLINNGHEKEYLDYSLEYTASLMEQFLMESKQQTDTPYWVIERKCNTGFKYWQIFNQKWVYDIHKATKWYIKSEAEAYLIHGHFKDDYVAEHMDVSEGKKKESKCECCDGTKYCEGEHFDDKQPCLTCGGSGKQPEQEASASHDDIEKALMKYFKKYFKAYYMNKNDQEVKSLIRLIKRLSLREVKMPDRKNNTGLVTNNGLIIKRINNLK